MNRRRLLRLSGSGILASVAGCAALKSRFSDAPQLPEGMSIETQIWPAGNFYTEDAYGFPIVAASAGAATDRLKSTRYNREERGDPTPFEFIENTAFEDAYLLMDERWVYVGASLEIRRVERDDYTIHVEAEFDVPPGSDHNAWSAMFLRVQDSWEPPPEQATLAVAE